MVNFVIGLGSCCFSIYVFLVKMVFPKYFNESHKYFEETLLKDELEGIYDAEKKFWQRYHFSKEKRKCPNCNVDIQLDYVKSETEGKHVFICNYCKYTLTIPYGDLGKLY